MTIIDVQHLRKTFGAVTAVDGLSLCIEKPGVVALLGPNGAGKTTTIDMLLGLRRPSSGTVRVFGDDPKLTSVRSRIGCAPQQSGVPETLHVDEVLAFVAAQYPAACSVAQALSDFGLTRFAKRQAGALSGGELRSLTLALAFIGQPDLVVLDEPTNGLDLESRRRVWEYVRSYAGAGGTVLLTTHHVEEAQALADRIVLVESGRIIADGAPDTIRRSGGLRRIVYIDDRGEQVSVTTDDTDAAIRELVRSNVPFRNLAIVEDSLEEAVLSLLKETV